MKKEEIYRDTKNWYLHISKYVSPKLINFVNQNAETGAEILDVGCATGEYCTKFNELGFKCVGIDVNPDYIEKTKKNGVDAYVMDAKSLAFPNNSFGTVLLFEVLEHTNNLDEIIREAKRVAKKNILITVPNNTEFYKLKKLGLTYSHMLEIDHINFFTKDDLERLLSKHFKKFKVEKREPIYLLPNWIRLPLVLLKFNKAPIYYRLYAIGEVEA